MNTKVMFSSNSNEWTTPDDLYQILDSEFHFTLDAASTDENAKCPRHFTAEDNGLEQNWGGQAYSAIRRMEKRSYCGCERHTKNLESQIRKSCCLFQPGRTLATFMTTFSARQAKSGSYADECILETELRQLHFLQ